MGHFRGSSKERNFTGLSLCNGGVVEKGEERLLHLGAREPLAGLAGREQVRSTEVSCLFLITSFGRTHCQLPSWIVGIRPQSQVLNLLAALFSSVRWGQ